MVDLTGIVCFIISAGRSDYPHLLTHDMELGRDGP